MVVRFQAPANWLRYDLSAILQEFVDAKAAVQTLVNTPLQREWVEQLQQIQLKIEVAGTSRIEGAEFTDRELEAALRPGQNSSDLPTRSQRQANSAVNTYRWISKLPPDRPTDSALIRQIHAMLVSGCDDDHCPPGRLREADQNVIFGIPIHRGVEGGAPCAEAFNRFIQALRSDFHGHDPLIQALAAHYHLAAMHPFLDGNGRTARAVEALLLQRSGLSDVAFISMSNYYYDEKATYLAVLASVGARSHDLTEFLRFGLRGIAIQCARLLAEIRTNVTKALFRESMYRLFTRLQNKRKRVIHERQVRILNYLLERGSMDALGLAQLVEPFYGKLSHFGKALNRDLSELISLGAIEVSPEGRVQARLQWAQEITESEFFGRMKLLPKARSYKILP